MTTTDPTDEAPPGAITDHRRQRLILAAMCTALVAVVASVSGLNVAQQDLAVDLGASQSQLLWVINGYTLALAALLMPVGAIGDRWGRKPVLVSGLVVFMAANVAAAMAGTVTFLLVARVVAGVGAAMIMPVTLSVITSTFPPHERARAVGVWAGFAGAGGIIGLFTSSFMIDNFTWPWLFALPITLAAGALAVTLWVVPNSREVAHTRFDTVGSVLSALAIGGLVLGIHEGPERGWGDWLTLSGLVVGVLALVGFALWELRHDGPLLDVRIFRDRSLLSGSVALFALFGVMFGLFLVMMQFLQAVLGWSALRAATGLLPMALIMMPLSAVAPTLAERFGTRRILLAGLGLFTTGLVMLGAMTSVDGGYLSILPGLVVLALGMGLAMSPSTSAITSTLPADKQGVASALNDTVREVGGAFGIALIGSVLNATYRSGVEPATAGLPPEVADRIGDGIGSALAVAPVLGERAGAVVLAAQEALVDGWRSAMWVGAAIALLALVVVAVRAPRTDPVPADVGESDPDTTESSTDGAVARA